MTDQTLYLNAELIRSIDLLPELFATVKIAGYLHIVPLPPTPSPRPLTFASVGKLNAALARGTQQAAPLIDKARKAGGQVSDAFSRKVDEAGAAIERKAGKVADSVAEGIQHRAEKVVNDLKKRMLPPIFRW